MNDEINRPLIVFGVDITHSRLVDLAKLADQAEPFYIWVEEQFQRVLNRSEPFDTLLRESSEDDIRRAIQACYNASITTSLVMLSEAKHLSCPGAETLRFAQGDRTSPLI